MARRHRQPAVPPDPSTIWPSTNGKNKDHFYYAPNDPSILLSQYSTPTFASVYTSQGTGYMADYSSLSSFDYSQMDKAESDSLHNYENNLERHKGEKT